MEKIYCGSGKTKTGKYGNFESVSICLDDIPAEHITTGKNGKRYVNLTINKKKEPDQYGKDLSVQIDTWNPDNAATPKAAQSHTPKQEYSESEGDKLPF